MRIQVIEVPMVSVDERCTFVLEVLAHSDGFLGHGEGEWT
jgi:hypothetical protein